MNSQNNVRRWALGLLLFNLTLFIVVLVAQKRGYQHFTLPYVKAFAEAACIGALADWFAVVALFRHPLGIPLPHTAILPAKQVQLAQGVAKFISTHFLEPQMIAQQLKRLQIGTRLHHYAQELMTLNWIMMYLPQALRYAIDFVPKQPPQALREWLQTACISYLEPGRLGRVSAQLLMQVQEQQLDKKLVKTLAASLHEFVTAPDAKDRVRPWLNELLLAAQNHKASWWDKLKNQFQGQAIEWLDDWMIDKLLSWLSTLSLNVQIDDDHPVHTWIEQHISNWRNQVVHNQQWQEWLAAYVHQGIRSEMAQTLMDRIWGKSHAWLLDATSRSHSPLVMMLSYKIRTVILDYLAQEKQQIAITEKAAQWTSYALTEHQINIRDWLTAQMNMWTKERLTTALEGAIGRDLQHIRINGTLIGGLIGLMLYSVSQLI